MSAMSARAISIRALMVCLLATAACDESALPPLPKPAPTASAKVAAPTGSAAVPSAAESSAAVPSAKVYERVVLSQVYEVDKIYKSMTGPQSSEAVALEDLPAPELLWIVGFEAVMMDSEGKARISQEFMCHTNLDIDATQHRERFGWNKLTTGRLFTLSQGQYRIDMPKGFGIPILSSEALNLNTQVLNLNVREGKRQVRHKVVMRYMRDKELNQPMKALYVAGAFGLKLLEGQDGHYGLATAEAAPPPEQAGAEHGEHEHGEHGAGEHGAGEQAHHQAHGEGHTACLPGANAGQNEFKDEQGRKFTGHWVVEPGREVNHTRVTELMDLPFDTKVHYIAVHLHPFAESLALKDLTTGKVLYEAKTKQAERGVGLAHVDFFSSEAGIEVFKGHEYEIISVYENTSGEPQDSMAVMNLYLADEEFDVSKLEPAKPAGSATPVPKAAPSAAPSASGPGKLM
jgi:hypothetical protein